MNSKIAFDTHGVINAMRHGVLKVDTVSRDYDTCCLVSIYKINDIKVHLLYEVSSDGYVHKHHCDVGDFNFIEDISKREFVILALVIKIKNFKDARNRLMIYEVHEILSKLRKNENS